ncbi:outer membrane protein assembly factor BamB family protein [Streptomyces griseus]|uniref:outer membrane protein assembly factor BamB family protein n=1 Tax=Streptomyces griseus TaxID=1911 RepID=UPI0037AFCA99
MARRYSRTELRAAGAGLLVVVLLLLSLGDGRTTGKPSGPPNTLVVAWSYVTTGRALDARDVPPALSDEALAVPVGHSVRVIDTRSGQLLSIVNGFAEESPDLGLSGGVLFLVDTQDHFKDTLRAYDPATGRELWQRKAAPGPDGKGAGDFAVGGVLLTGWGPVVMDGDRALALDPRTGAVRWNVRLDAHCTTPRPYLDTPHRMAATSTHLLLLRHCTGETAELQAVDERDGRSVWRKRLGRGGTSVSARRTGPSAYAWTTSSGCSRKRARRSCARRVPDLRWGRNEGSCTRASTRSCWPSGQTPGSPPGNVPAPRSASPS